MKMKKMVVAVAALLVAGASAGQVYAATKTPSYTAGNPVDKNTFITKGKCPKCILAGYTNLTLPATIAADAKNPSQGLWVAYLNNASIKATNAAGQTASLAGYDLSSSEFINFTSNGVSMAGADLSCSFFNGANLGTSDLTGIRIAQAQCFIDFTGADLRYVIKPATWPIGTKLDNAKYVGSIICDADSSNGCKNVAKCKIDATHSGYINKTGDTCLAAGVTQ